jgi:hypothetical protein
MRLAASYEARFCEELRRIPFQWLKQKSILARALQRVKEACREAVGQSPIAAFIGSGSVARSEYLSRHSPPQTHGSSAVLFAKWDAEAVLPLRRFIVFCVLLGMLIFGCFMWRDFSSRRQLGQAPMPTINKQPVAFANHTFDPAAPPADMPPLASGETAECDSEFLSDASVRGESRQTDATHATVTITQIKVTLQLTIGIWVPIEVTQHVIEHEEGHRQISEYYYQTADKVAERIAAAYMGKQVEITGADLGAESSKMLQQMATDINDEYKKELNPGPAQLLYDTITDHGRNEVVVKDAVAHALKNVAIESP